MPFVEGVQAQGGVRRGPEGHRATEKRRGLGSHRLRWNPSWVPWLCDLGKLFSLSEAQFPHPQNKIVTGSATAQRLRVPQSCTPEDLVPKVVVWGGGGTFRSWGLVGGPWVAGDASLGRDCGSPALPSVWPCDVSVRSDTGSHHDLLPWQRLKPTGPPNLRPEPPEPPTSQGGCGTLPPSDPKLADARGVLGLRPVTLRPLLPPAQSQCEWGPL